MAGNKPKGKTYWRKKGCEEAKRIKRQQKGACEICGKRGGKLEGHHLLTVGAYPNMSNHLDNIIVVCVHCHKFGKISFHGTPDLMVEIMEQKYPGRYKFLRKLAQERKRVDYKAEYEGLNPPLLGKPNRSNKNPIDN